MAAEAEKRQWLDISGGVQKSVHMLYIGIRLRLFARLLSAAVLQTF
jgi:hypothetical protein